MRSKCSYCKELEQKLKQHEEVIAQLVGRVAHVHRQLNTMPTNEAYHNPPLKKAMLPY